jgi:hypothetical protein
VDKNLQAIRLPDVMRKYYKLYNDPKYGDFSFNSLLNKSSFIYVPSRMLGLKQFSSSSKYDEKDIRESFHKKFKTIYAIFKILWWNITMFFHCFTLFFPCNFLFVSFFQNGSKVKLWFINLYKRVILRYIQYVWYIF